jgi:hypothetical protein
MHTHDGLTGPVRGSSAWWKGAADDGGAPETERVEPKPAAKSPFVRWDLVERVKQEIAQGVYDTPEKWDAALDRLLESL